jgi:hypothetical protein
MRIARRSSGLIAELRSAGQPRAAVPTLLVVILLSTFVFAADVTGRWKGPMQSGGDAVFDLKSDKGTISGTMLGYDGKPRPVSEGKLDGDAISMKIATDWQGQPITLIVTGKVSGDEMQLHIASDNGYWSTDAAVKREKMER